MKRKTKKNVTLDDLAGMVAKGFGGVEVKMDGLERRMGGLEKRMDGLEKQMVELRETIQDIANKLAHYIDLHEERYLDLKHRYRLLAKAVEKIAAKTGVRFEALED